MICSWVVEGLLALYIHAGLERNPTWKGMLQVDGPTAGLPRRRFTWPAKLDNLFLDPKEEHKRLVIGILRMQYNAMHSPWELVINGQLQPIR